jgi:hypothetical protein
MVMTFVSELFGWIIYGTIVMIFVKVLCGY